MKQIIIANIPSSVDGLYSSYKLILQYREEELINELINEFSCNTSNIYIREAYKKPENKENSTEYEDWIFNDKISKLSWNELDIHNSGIILANYSFLYSVEKMMFQPVLWKYIFFSRQWIKLFSRAIFIFTTDINSTFENMFKMMSNEQLSVLNKCFLKIRKYLDNGVYTVERSINIEEELYNLDVLINHLKI